jgi:crotonobetaine/carnitine-CoA ligase
MHDLMGERDDSSCGKPTLWSRIKIADNDQPGVGELLIGGEPGRTLMLGYLNDPEATAARFQDGWLHTGDVVAVDDRGYVTFVDRTDDLVKPLAENVSTVEIERVLTEHPAVAQAAVVGATSQGATLVKALVVVHPGEITDADTLVDELSDWCRERLADYKVPQQITIVDILPTSLVGKVRKSLLT